MKIRWLSQASADLAEIHSYLFAENPNAADRVVDEIVQAVAQLGVTPAMGRAGRVAETRELILERYIVAYRVKSDVVQVLRILHQTRRWPVRFK